MPCHIDTWRRDSAGHGARRVSLAKTKHAYDLERLNFLVVDDNWHIRALVRSILDALGVKSVLDAGDGADALKELRDFPADMIICDWSMSPLDGIEFARLIRSGGGSSPNRYVPIIMLTGHTEMNRVLECRDAGVNEFLAKPISPKGLYDRICEIIENPREFIDIKNYMGPDRRRANPDYNGPDRREGQPADQPTADAGDELDQGDVDALLNG